MGLRDDLWTDIAEAFDTDLADAVQPFTGGITLPGGQWDPVTETAGDPVVISYSGRGVCDGYSIDLIDGVNIKSTDKMLIALVNEVTGSPQVGHKINGMDVKSVTIDPAGATYQIQLREV